RISAQSTKYPTMHSPPSECAISSRLERLLRPRLGIKTESVSPQKRQSNTATATTGPTVSSVSFEFCAPNMEFSPPPDAFNNILTEDSPASQRQTEHYAKNATAWTVLRLLADTLPLPWSTVKKLLSNTRIWLSYCVLV